jgi:uncharacterized protein (TIGR02145 family)
MKKVLHVAAAVAVLAGCAAAQTFTDQRDGKTYRAAKIGKQVWMGENLNYRADSSWCYKDNPDNCKKYGRLYHWDAAIKACPAGWHLPTREEWDGLVTFASGKETADTKLKSKSPNWDGTDDYGFSAMPGGLRNAGGRFIYLGSHGYWWTATEYNASGAYARSIVNGSAGMHENYGYKGNGFSVRCLRD